MGDLYRRYLQAKEFGARHNDWGGLSVESVKEFCLGGKILIERNEREIGAFIEQMREKIPSFSD